MPSMPANGIRLEYDEFGSTEDPAILLIMGLATQMVAWPVSFCEQLAECGFRVIRFDNRDVGLSTKFHGATAPGPVKARVNYMLGRRFDVPYTLADMATDAVALLDALEVERAHVAGVSMGGMIGQRMAIDHPHRLHSLTSIMSSSGHRKLPGPRPGVIRHMIFSRPSRPDREALMDYMLALLERIGSPGYPVAEEERRKQIALSLDRSINPPAFRRHMAAVLHDGDRSDQLRGVQAPTLVVHGTDDPLVPVECGKHAAECIPDARLELIPGMGHDLPPGLFPELIRLISEHARESGPPE